MVLIFDLDKVTIKMYTQGIFLQEYFFCKKYYLPPPFKTLTINELKMKMFFGGVRCCRRLTTICKNVLNMPFHNPRPFFNEASRNLKKVRLFLKKV